MPKGTPNFEDKILKLIERKDKEISKLNRLIQSEQKNIARMLETYNKISYVLETLTDRERELVEQYYFEKQRRIDVCSDMEIGLSTFKRIHAAALEKLKEELEKEN